MVFPLFGISGFPTLIPSIQSFFTKKIEETKQASLQFKTETDIQESLFIRQQAARDVAEAEARQAAAEAEAEVAKAEAKVVEIRQRAGSGFSGIIPEVKEVIFGKPLPDITGSSTFSSAGAVPTGPLPTQPSGSGLSGTQIIRDILPQAVPAAGKLNTGLLIAGAVVVGLLFSRK